MKERLINVLKYLFTLVLALPIIILMFVEFCTLFIIEYIVVGNKYPFLAYVYMAMGRWIWGDEWFK